MTSFIPVIFCSASVCVQPSGNIFVSDTDETAEAPSQQQVKDNTVRAQNRETHHTNMLNVVLEGEIHHGL